MARLSDGTWEDCGCPLSMAHLASYRVDLTIRPHICLVSRDEWRKHYVLDRHAYERARKAPRESSLGRWVARRLREGRLFVAKPPERPPLPPEPWRYDEEPAPPGPAPGWRHWEAADEALRMDSEWATPALYDAMMDELFELLGVGGVTKKLMLASAEAWLLACGTAAPAVRVSSRTPVKNDRVFVTADNEFFSLLAGVLASKNLSNSVAQFLDSLALGTRVKHLRRLLDIRIDCKLRLGGCGHVFNFI